MASCRTSYLLEAAEYLERENPTAATATLERIVKAVYRLEHYPGIGRAGRIEGTCDWW